jgi:hypothetical protein
MSQLKQIQRRMAAAIFTPLTPNDGMKPRDSSGRSMHAQAREFIKPNDRLSSFERLEIYNRQYWFRVLDSLTDDFPGLRAIVGERRFERISRAYLAECPSRSYTLRDLGSRLPAWLRRHPEFTHPRETLALQMARLEWAHTEAFDAAAKRALGPEDLLEVTPALKLSLQPHIRLLQLSYPLDELLLSVKEGLKKHDSDVASNAGSTQRKTHPAIASIEELKPQPIYLAVHRKQFAVYCRRLEREAFRVLRAIECGEPLGRALEHGGRSSKLGPDELAARFQVWFADWSQMGWFAKP